MGSGGGTGRRKKRRKEKLCLACKNKKNKWMNNFWYIAYLWAMAVLLFFAPTCEPLSFDNTLTFRVITD